VIVEPMDKRFLAGSRAEISLDGMNSVFANFFVDAIGPGVDTPAQVDHLLKALSLQELDSLHSARSHFADCNDLLAGVQLPVAPGELGQGNQVPSNV